jgi:hypothetical protein
VRFRIEQRFDGPLDAVEEAFVDPAFIEALGELPKLGRPRLLDQRADGDLVHQRVQYAFAGDLSPAVTAVVDPAKLTWVEESTLDRRTHRTTFRIVPDHYRNRLQASGSFALTADGDATRRVAEGDVKVHFALVGGRVEKAIVSGLHEHADMEERVMAGWLAQPEG